MEENTLEATMTVFLTMQWNPYKGDTGDWDLSLDWYRPVGDSTTVLIKELTITETHTMDHEMRVKLQLGKYDDKEAHLEKELGKDKVLLNKLRQDLLALPHLPDPADDGISSIGNPDPMDTDGNPDEIPL